MYGVTAVGIDQRLYGGTAVGIDQRLSVPVGVPRGTVVRLYGAATLYGRVQSSDCTEWARPVGVRCRYCLVYGVGTACRY